MPETKGYFDVDVTAGEQVDFQLRLQNNEANSIEEVQEFAETTNPMAEVDEEENEGIPGWVWIIAAIAFGLLMFFMGRRKKPKAE